MSQNPTAQIFTSTVALMNGFAPLRQTNVAIILNNGVIWVKSWQASKSHDTHYWMLNILSAVDYNSTEDKIRFGDPAGSATWNHVNQNTCVEKQDYMDFFCEMVILNQTNQIKGVIKTTAEYWPAPPGVWSAGTGHNELGLLSWTSAVSEKDDSD